MRGAPLLLLLSTAVAGCGHKPSSTLAASSAACSFWGGRGYSLTVRASSSHALQFRELAYDDASGVVRVHDSDLFANGSEAKEPRVLQRSLTLVPAQRDALTAELMAWCPTDEELVFDEAFGGGAMVLEVRAASGATVKARFVPRVGSDVARKTFVRLQVFFPELRQTP